MHRHRPGRRRARALAAGLLATVALLPAAEPARASRVDCVPLAGWPAADAALAQRVVDVTNAHRASAGLSPLQASPVLANAAVWKAREIAGDGNFSHVDTSGRQPAQRLQACGHAAAGFGENIAANQPTPEAVLQAWLASPAHRANLDNPAFRTIGVGVAVGGAYGHTWVQVFGT